MDLKERIKELCKEKGISLNKLEADCGVAKGYISKLDKSSPSVATIQRIADYLGVSLDYLIKGEYYSNPETAQAAQEAFDKYKILFDAAEGSRPEDIRFVVDFLNRLKETNPDG